MNPWIKRSLLLAGAAILVFALLRAFQPTAIIVDTGEVARGPLVVTVDDDGFTRVQERYTVSAPMAGRLLRTSLKAGAPVVAQETLIAEFEPLAPHLLDDRTRAEVQARVERAQAALQSSKARESQAQADLAFAKSELARMEALYAKGTQPRKDLDLAQRDARRAEAGLRAAEFDIQVAQHELQIAQAGAMEGSDREAALRIPLWSPIDGRVMRVFENSERPVVAGTPILEVGNPNALEVVADFLSQDAVKVQAGFPVRIEGWGGERTDGTEEVLFGEVRLVEPAGVTKISALGVEEQRVAIIVDPVAPLDGWERLADGYRVELRIVVWETDDALIVPTGALFREGGEWRVFVVQGERVQQAAVQIGHRNGLQAEVLDGLQENDRVVLYPSELISTGTKIEARLR